jgi:hypothetical protein
VAKLYGRIVPAERRAALTPLTWFVAPPRSGPDLADSGPLDTHSATFIFASADSDRVTPRGVAWDG